MIKEDERVNKVKIEKKKIEKKMKKETMLMMWHKRSFVKFIAKLPLLYMVQTCINIVFGF